MAFLFASISNAEIPNLVTKVILTGSDGSTVPLKIQENLTLILNNLNNIKENKTYFTKEGLTQFIDLYEKSEFKCINVLYNGKLINLQNGGYEVRGIRVRVNMKTTKGNPDQFLVFTFNSNLIIEDVNFAMEKHLYERIIEDGIKLKDFAHRQKIIHFIEIFRTAYNRKDIEYLEKAYSDDALIIVGRVLETAPEQPEMLEKSYLSKDQIIFVKKSKEEYISSLRNVFSTNDFIKVDFESLNIIRHDSILDIYGVTLKQRWKSSNYSDEGFLFLMIDFADEDSPLIHVRTWQPEKFPDGSVISLYDFNIVE